MPNLRVISYGGGVQSTALLVLAVRGELGRVDAALFANVGDDSEDPDTLAYVRRTAIPFGHQGGVWADRCRPLWQGVQVPVFELHRFHRGGRRIRTLYEELTRPESRSLSIPVRMADTGAPGRRRCTADYKLKVVGRWLKLRGAHATEPADVLIGISWDEAHRLNDKRAEAWERPQYPLVDRRLTREDCKAIISSAGLPIPSKSSCWFCPFRKPTDFARMRRDRPELFDKAVRLEATLNRRRERLGKDPVYLTRFGKPLAEAVSEAGAELDFGTGPGETCDEGYCWT